jgi:lysophospholipase L1-like esterase
MATLKICPVGDSITLGSPGLNGGYRIRLGERLTEYGVDFEFVGRETEDLGGDHEGYSGLNIAQIRTVALEAVEIFEPDVVLVIGGTNNNPKVPADYVAACNDIKAAGPSLVLAGTIPPRGDLEGVAPTVAFNAALPAAFAADADPGVQLVDVSGTLTATDDLADTVHPNDQGYDKIAAAWFAALQDLELAVVPVTRLEAKIDAVPLVVPIGATVSRVLTVYAVTYDEAGKVTDRSRFDLTDAFVAMSVKDAAGVVVFEKTSDNPQEIDLLEQSGATLGQAAVRFVGADTEDLDPLLHYRFDVWVRRPDAFDTFEQVLSPRRFVVGRAVYNP